MAETQVPKFDLKQLLGDRLLIKSDGNEQSQPVSSLEGKYVAIYFSAHWFSPPPTFEHR